MSFEISGIDEMLAKLQKKGQNVGAVKVKALKAGAEPIRKAMSDHAPRGVKKTQSWQYTHNKKYAVEHLKDNIIVSNAKDDMVYVGPEEHFFYGSFLEYGTVNMAAQPFAEPGYLEGRKEALENIAEVVKEAIENG